MSRYRVTVLGASGYVGCELVRLLAQHPTVELVGLGANRQAGQPISALFPQLASLDLPPLEGSESLLAKEVDLVFCAVPHRTAQPLVRSLMARQSPPKVIDLSADFRLRDPAVYEAWYGVPQETRDLLAQAVYGIPELNRANLKNARLVAVPGCYPTPAQLALVPLVKAGLVKPESRIVIDAKSGVTGAGRSAQERLLHAEVSENFSAYGIASHRHIPEIDQGLALFAGRSQPVTFTAHLLPMNRGILETIYIELADPAANADTIKTCWHKAYADEPFIQLVDAAPETRHVRGSNDCRLAAFDDRGSGQVVLIAVIDNLVKGAAGQAVQSMNILLDLPETTSLKALPLAP